MKHKMIELNLLPKEMQKKKKVPVQVNDIPVIRISVIVLSILIVLHGVILFFNARNQVRLREYSVQWDEMGPQRELTGKLVRDRGELAKKLKAIRGITEFGFDWTRLLNGLNEAVIPKIWLAELELKFSRPEKTKGKQISEKVPVAINITGYALGNSQEATSVVAKFITSLKNDQEFSAYFSEIELQNMRTREVDGKEVMRFILNCKLKSSEPGNPKSGITKTGKRK